MLSELSVKDFLDRLSSGSPVPGGGSVAALCGAIAASLSGMVAALTIGKKGFESLEAEMREIAEKALGYRDRFLEDVDRDSDAYQDVMTASRLPKETEEEKSKRKQAIQEALKKAASVPMQVAERAIEAMELVERVVEKGNPNAITDGAVAALLARSVVLGAIYNVKTNLHSIEDEEFVNPVMEQVKLIEKEIGRREGKILARIDL